MNRRLAATALSFLLLSLTAAFILALIIGRNPPGAQEHPLPPGTVTVECDNITITAPPGSLLVYTWIHSVEGTPITEKYIATPQGLVLVEAESESFGAGHPYSAEELGGEFRFEDGRMVYEANYSIGYTLEIIGNPDYSGNITLVPSGGGAIAACIDFVYAVIRVAPTPP